MNYGAPTTCSEPVQPDYTLRRSPLTYYFFTDLVTDVHFLEFLVPLGGQEERLVLPAVLVHLPAGIEVERGVVHAAAAAHQQHLALLHEEEHADAGAAAASVQGALSGGALKQAGLPRLVT